VVGDSLVAFTACSECRTTRIVQASCCCLLAAVQPADEADEGRLLSVDGRRAVATRLFKYSGRRRVATPVLLSSSRDGLRRLSAKRWADRMALSQDQS
jgi:hypothetical protein